MKSFLLCLSLFAHAVLLAQAPATRPNVVIILTDDQGWGDLSVHGNVNLQTPNIDELARAGARFSNFYVSPVCSPTRAEILTGRYHPRGGVYDTSSGGERLDLDETTIGQIFRSAGYVTGAYGKWHNGTQYPYHPNARGFDDFYGFCSGHWGDYFSPTLEHNGKQVKGNGFITDDLTDHALEFIDKNRERPFLLYIPFNAPHSPMQVPDRWWNKFSDKKLEMLSGEDEDIQFTRAALAMCENIDWNVGRIMQKLKDAHLEENTIVFYLSDNGPNSWRWNGGLKGRKGSTDEGGVRVPLFVRWTGKIEAGRSIPQIAAAIDLFPTLIDLAGIEVSHGKQLDGVTLTPLLFDESPQWPDRVLFSHWNGRVSVRTQRYRLDHAGGLFDMENDPRQVRDIASQHVALADSLNMARQRWADEVLAELPVRDERPFIVGHPDARYTELPARDGVPYGNIRRSNRWPNCSFFTGWTDVRDSITWDTEVAAAGDFDVVLYYTCPDNDVGATVELSFGAAKVAGTITEGHDPPLRGMENDRVQRVESYVKDFNALQLGVMRLEKGRGLLTLKALDMPGNQVMDLRLITFERLRKPQ